MPRRQVDVSVVSRKLRAPFVIARGTKTVQVALCVSITEGESTGHGESSGVEYKGETAQTMLADVERVRGALQDGASRHDVLDFLPPGGARAACDGALWDLEAKASGEAAWELAGLSEAPAPVVTATTLTLSTPTDMLAAAQRAKYSKLIKVKIGGGDGLDIDRVRAVRQGAPHATLVVDGNQGCLDHELRALCDALSELDVKLLEQPLRRGEDHKLLDVQTDVPLCADESLDTAADVAELSKIYQYGNIKLDKCGGLTAGLELADRLEEAGMGIFIGCMICGTRSIAPSFLLTHRATYIDLDGPLWLAEDSHTTHLNEDGLLPPPPKEFWG
ncbi:MAG: dipeptide epimerase [Pseudomonadota bacterium]